MSHDIKARVLKVAGTQKKWAEATGANVEHVSRVLSGKYPVPEWWFALLEFLETTAPQDWPDRWERK
jgi:hypothetical protein